MPFEWDEAKQLANLVKHGVDFDDVTEFDWDQAWVQVDTRNDYGEIRLTAIAPIGDRVHAMVFTIRRTRLRLISLRRANTREFSGYVDQI